MKIMLDIETCENHKHCIKTPNYRIVMNKNKSFRTLRVTTKVKCFQDLRNDCFDFKDNPGIQGPV